MSLWPGYTPSADPLHQLAGRYARAYKYASYGLWGLAIVGALGDVITTWVGVTSLLGGPYGEVYESVGLTAWVLNTVGAWALLLQKALCLVLVWGVSRIFPRPYPLGLALTVASVNGAVVISNLYVLHTTGAITLG